MSLERIDRIIAHWTAGGYGVIPLEADSYNYIVGPDGAVTPGTFPARAQTPPLVSGKYAAHTLNCNSYSLGVAVDAMAGAVERPFNPGKFPITPAQYTGLIQLIAREAKKYSIRVDRRTVLTHAEVQRTLGIAQRNKWDISWLPGMTVPGDPILVGDRIREDVRRAMA